MISNDVETTPTANTHRRVVINRPVFNQSTFDRKFSLHDDVIKPSLGQRLKRLVADSCCDESGCHGDGTSRVARKVGGKIIGLLPVVKHLRQYRWRKWLINDIMSGVSSGVVHVPQVSKNNCT